MVYKKYITSTAYNNAKTHKVSMTSAASAEAGASFLGVGASVKHETSNSETNNEEQKFKNAFKEGRSSIVVMGGTPSGYDPTTVGGFADWANKVGSAPMPIKYELRPLTYLVCAMGPRTRACVVFFIGACMCADSAVRCLSQAVAIGSAWVPPPPPPPFSPPPSPYPPWPDVLRTDEDEKPNGANGTGATVQELAEGSGKPGLVVYPMQTLNPPPPPRLPRSMNYKTACKRGFAVAESQVLMGRVHVDSSCGKDDANTQASKCNFLSALQECWKLVWEKYPSASEPFLTADGFMIGVRNHDEILGQCYALFGLAGYRSSQANNSTDWQVCQDDGSGMGAIKLVKIHAPPPPEPPPPPSSSPPPFPPTKSGESFIAAYDYYLADFAIYAKQDAYKTPCGTCARETPAPSAVSSLTFALPFAFARSAGGACAGVRALVWRPGPGFVARTRGRHRCVTQETCLLPPQCKHILLRVRNRSCAPAYACVAQTSSSAAVAASTSHKAPWYPSLKWSQRTCASANASTTKAAVQWSTGQSILRKSADV